MAIGHHRSFPIRLIGALALDPATYEVEADQRATGQACLVVLMSSVSGIGAGWGNGSIPRIV